MVFSYVFRGNKRLVRRNQELMADMQKKIFIPEREVIWKVFDEGVLSQLKPSL
jgi:hypothetical protein